MEEIAPGLISFVINDVVVKETELKPGPDSRHFELEGLNDNIEDWSVKKNNQGVLIPAKLCFVWSFNVLNWQIISYLQISSFGKFDVIRVGIIEIAGPGFVVGGQGVLTFNIWKFVINNVNGLLGKAGVFTSEGSGGKSNDRFHSKY